MRGPVVGFREGFEADAECFIWVIRHDFQQAGTTLYMFKVETIGIDFVHKALFNKLETMVIITGSKCSSHNVIQIGCKDNATFVKQFQRGLTFFCRSCERPGFSYIYTMEFYPDLTFNIMRTFLLCFLLLPVFIKAQSIVPVAPESLTGVSVGTAEYYDIESVMEYNEDADMFIEYGFNALMVQYIILGDAKLKVEAYLMQSAEAAFGAWSVSVSGCQQRDSAMAYDCGSLYRYQCAYGKLYISVSSETGSEAVRSLFVPLARVLVQNNPQQPFYLPEPFNQPAMKKSRNTLTYTKGLIGMQNVLIPWQELFPGVEAGVYAIILPRGEYEIYFARIRFATPDSKMRFLGLAGLLDNGVPVPNTNTNDGLYREFSEIDMQTIYFLQSQEPWPINAVIAP